MKKRNLVLVIAAISVFMAGCINGPSYIVYKDMNNDGINDMVISMYDYSNKDVISIASGAISEGFAREIVRTELEKGTTTVFDLNQDGKQDIIYQTTYLDESWMILYGKGDGTFEDPKKMEIDDIQHIKNSKSN